MRCASSTRKIWFAGLAPYGENVQLHGGMGVTEELRIGHYFKRLLVIDAQFGSIIIWRVLLDKQPQIVLFCLKTHLLFPLLAVCFSG